MEKTQIYILGYSGNMYYGDKIIGFTTSKEEAEYWVYKQHREIIDSSTIYRSLHPYYNVLSPIKIDIDQKLYKKYVNEKIEEKQKKINDYKSHSEEDLMKAEKVNEELNYYKSKLI